MIGETAASNMQNLTEIATQNQLQVSTTMNKNIGNMRAQGLINANLNNMSAGISAGNPSPYDIN